MVIFEGILEVAKIPVEANFYCDTYGICTITWGTVLGFVMECYENGILNDERTGGLKLNFGSADAAMELLHQLATTSN